MPLLLAAMVTQRVALTLTLTLTLTLALAPTLTLTLTLTRSRLSLGVGAGAARGGVGALACYQVFDGALTFAKAARLHELAFDVPLNRLLLASAAPRNLPTQAEFRG